VDISRERKIHIKSDVLVFWDLDEGVKKCKKRERKKGISMEGESVWDG